MANTQTSARISIPSVTRMPVIANSNATTDPTVMYQDLAEQLASLRTQYIDAELERLSDKLRSELARHNVLFDVSDQSTGLLTELYAEALRQRSEAQADAVDEVIDLARDDNPDQLLKVLADRLLQPQSTPAQPPRTTRPALQLRSQPQPEPSPPQQRPSLLRNRTDIPYGLDIWLR